MQEIHPNLNDLVLAHLKKKSMYSLSETLTRPLPGQGKSLAAQWLARYDVYWASQRFAVLTIWPTQVSFDAHDWFPLQRVQAFVDFHEPDSFEKLDKGLRRLCWDAFWHSPWFHKFNWVWESTYFAIVNVPRLQYLLILLIFLFSLLGLFYHIGYLGDLLHLVFGVA